MTTATPVDPRASRTRPHRPGRVPEEQGRQHEGTGRRARPRWRRRARTRSGRPRGRPGPGTRPGGRGATPRHLPGRRCRPPRPRIPSGPRPAGRTARDRSTGPGWPAPTGRRRRRPGHPIVRGPARCRAGGRPGRPTRPPVPPAATRTGRSSRTVPQAPSGRHPKIRTFWVRPMAPSSTVPTTPEMASAGVAGAVVPTPDGCQPVKNWANVDDHDGNGVNCPRAGRRPVSTPREPITTRRPATSHTARRTAPRDPARLGLLDARLDLEALVGRPVGLDRHGRGRRQFVGVGPVEPELEDPTEVGREPGAPPDLEEADLLVADPPLGLEGRPSGPGGAHPGEVPAPRPHHGPGPRPVARQLGHHDLAHRQEEDLGHDAPQVAAGVAGEHGQQLVAALEFLEGHRSELVDVGHRGVGGSCALRGPGIGGTGPVRRPVAHRSPARPGP